MNTPANHRNLLVHVPTCGVEHRGTPVVSRVPVQFQSRRSASTDDSLICFKVQVGSSGRVPVRCESRSARGSLGTLPMGPSPRPHDPTLVELGTRLTRHRRRSQVRVTSYSGAQSTHVWDDGLTGVTTGRNVWPRASPGTCPTHECVPGHTYGRKIDEKGCSGSTEIGVTVPPLPCHKVRLRAWSKKK